MAPAKRSNHLLSTYPDVPARPSASVPGEFNCTETKFGVTARDQSVKIVFWPACRPCVYSPSMVVPASMSTTLPSIDMTGALRMHLRNPG